MNEQRKLAHSILVRTRDILAEQLTERIVEDEQSILDDATGTDYMDDIGRLYESVGVKLGQINSMIANLPINEEPDRTPPMFKQPPAMKMAQPIPAAAGADEPKTFATFGQQVFSNEIELAAQTLSELLAISLQQALHSANCFQQKLRSDPHTIQKTMQLRAELYAGNINNCLVILHECFGLQGIEAAQVVQHLLSQVA